MKGQEGENTLFIVGTSLSTTSHVSHQFTSFFTSIIASHNTPDCTKCHRVLQVHCICRLHSLVSAD